MNALMKVCFPIRTELMTTVRLMTGGLGSHVGLGVDDTEDCKACVTESLLMLLSAGYRSAELLFSEDDGLSVSVTGTDKTQNKVSMYEEEISMALLEALSEGFVIEKEAGVLRTLRFRFAL